VIEAARGVGMTDLQQLRRVELPLALPVIVAGIRTATVWTVGMATLSTPVGATSLGNFIFSGLQTRNFAAVLVGSISAALLALTLDGLVLSLERGLRERRRGVLGAAIAAAIALYAYAGATLAGALHHHAQRPVAIGAKTFTEQYVLAELLARWIEREAGLPARISPSLGSTVAFDALRAGEIDLYVDYSGTLWTTVLHRDAPPPSRAAAIDEIRRVLREQDGIEVAAALGFENAYALAMREADAERLGVRTISDLAAIAGARAIGGDYEFFARPEWRALETTYGLRFREQRTMDPSLLYQAVASGGVDVISAYSTDGRIEALHLRVLEDDRHAIPPYDALVLTRRGLAQAEPGVAAALARLDGALDADRMRQLNRLVDQQGESPGAAAERGLALLAPGDRPSRAAPGATAPPAAAAAAKSPARP
jgi:osmoprotectant transport system permease protein